MKVEIKWDVKVEEQEVYRNTWKRNWVMKRNRIKIHTKVEV